jgi:hypothetical protein
MKLEGRCREGAETGRKMETSKEQDEQEQSAGRLQRHARCRSPHESRIGPLQRQTSPDPPWARLMREAGQSEEHHRAEVQRAEVQAWRMQVQRRRGGRRQLVQVPSCSARSA